LERVGYDEEENVGDGNDGNGGDHGDKGGDCDDEDEDDDDDGSDINAPVRQSSALPPGFQARWPRVQLYWLHLKNS